VAEAPKLRVISGEGEVVQDDGSLLPADYALIDAECRRLRRQVSALRGQISRLQRVDPQAELIERILVAWRDRCHGPTSRVEVAIDGKRADIVRKTLRRLIENDPDPELANPSKVAHEDATQRAEARAVERIMAAIDGAAKFPYEGAYGRRFSEATPGAKKKCEITYLLRDEVKLEQFVALVEADERRLAYAADIWRMVQTQPNLRLILKQFGPEPQGELVARLIRWCCANG
jgi:hypothetical protein